MVSRAGKVSDGDEGGWLPTTAYAILGLLSFGEEFTGYELRRRALASLRYFFWSPAMSQVYTELRRLKGSGLVAERSAHEVRLAGGRQARMVGETPLMQMAKQKGRIEENAKHAKSVFAITPQGTEALARWVADGPADWNMLKHLTCLRLFYGHLVEPAKLIERMEAHRDWALQMREELAVKPPRMPADPRWEYAKLVVEWGLEYYAEEAESADRLAKKLRRLPAGLAKRAKTIGTAEMSKTVGSTMASSSAKTAGRTSPAKRRRS